VLSADTGGEGSRSLVGMGAGLDGGGPTGSDARCVGDDVLSDLNVERVLFSGIVFMGLSSGVGVDTGELVS
jgi:hypothetical protein